MHPAKKVREDFVGARLKREPETLEADLIASEARANIFEALYLRTRIEIANANKGIKRLKRVVEAREKRIVELSGEINQLNTQIENQRLNIRKLDNIIRTAQPAGDGLYRYGPQYQK